MPKLVRFYIRHCLIGFGISAVFVGMLLAFDVMNLRHLILNDEAAALAIFVLWFLNGIVFASVQFGYAIMQLAKDDDSKSGGKRITVHVPRDAVPVRVAAGGRAPLKGRTKD